MFNFDKRASELYKAKKENSIEPTGSGDALQLMNTFGLITDCTIYGALVCLSNNQ